MLEDRERAPLYEALVAHDKLNMHAFHVPGHKQRPIEGDAQAIAYYDKLLSLDVTELSDTDDLHHPEGPLVEAQQLAANCWGAEETRFLVGGSTSGNLAMIIGLCHPGDLVIVQRNVHKSMVHGIMMAGARAVLLPPDIDSASGLATVPAESLLRASLERYPEAKAVILSSPNYYGMSSDLKPLIQAAHSFGIPVLIDEAHGPHFGLHPLFPQSALQAGADVAVQSTHKMLSAMTMGAMLHMQGNRLPRPSIRQALTMVQSSSPSFPIMGSLDLARWQLHTQGEKAFISPLEAVNLATKGLNDTSIRAIGYGEYASSNISYDPLKLVLFDATFTLSGFELKDELLHRKCVAEMADSTYVVMAFGTGSTKEDGECLSAALKAISDKISNKISGKSESNQAAHSISKQRIVNPYNGEITVPEPVFIGRKMEPTQAIRLEDSVGSISAEWVIPYPPGIPVLYPGETITSEIILQLQHWRHEGAQIQGAQDAELQYIQVQVDK
ncbi:aminotransferase class I/II-fold pyridoxal phosphate-dependent enzyme [Cohnella abietis]|uniref:Arginine decarboxylase n=1 Tax=Cohnella abietis TaxID=2507935 RepID=A0A3T1CXP4_9BACL|nr:aminotransferase class I/II-fold pyridoxal phosphate-dependent enzyme [Cohnella abietis]BBI30622.1 hypothetical protein KCTCHS21_00210 [Cohnella abietis]